MQHFKIAILVVAMSIVVACLFAQQIRQPAMIYIESTIPRELDNPNFRAFLLDYDQYELCYIYNCTVNLWDCYCPGGIYSFDLNTISAEDLTDLLNSDERVLSAFWMNEDDLITRPRQLAIGLSDPSYEAEFIASYSEFELSGSIPTSLANQPLLKAFTYNDTIINPRLLWNLILADDRVIFADFCFAWIDGNIDVTLQNWVIGDLLMEFLADYPPLSYQHLNYQVNILKLKYDFMLYNEFYLLEQFQNDNRVISTDLPWVVFPTPGNQSLITRPINLSATYENNNIELNWSNDPRFGLYPISYYRVYRDDELIADNISTMSYSDENIVEGFQYSYFVRSYNATHNIESYRTDIVTITATVSEVDKIDFPDVSTLIGNYPNPFNPTTNIMYHLAKEEIVKIQIYNIKGQVIKNLLHETQKAGEKSIIWNGEDDNGSSVSSGIYFYRLQSNDFSVTRKMVLMK